jgi:hypothetical protein
MNKDVKPCCSAYYAIGLVNKLPIFTGAAPLLGLPDLEHRYNTLL